MGVVVPAYFSSRPSDEMVQRLLWMTLADCHHYVPLENVWVVVDGDPRAERLLVDVRARLESEHGESFTLLSLPENRGKLWAVRQGISALLAARPGVRYLVIRDGDGDHAASELPRLARAAAHLADVYDTLRLIVIGSRSSRHRPMGWIRGELEALLDRITIDALAYHLAREGKAINMGHCSGRAVPDLSSGYKVYGRQVAEELFTTDEAHMACLSSEDYWHYGPETVTIVEAVLDGAILAEVPRLTWDGQPTSSFGEFSHESLYGELLAWVYARLDIPLDVAARLYDNLIPPMTLRTAPQGTKLLRAVRDYALDKVRAFRGDSHEIPPPAPISPFL